MGVNVKPGTALTVVEGVSGMWHYHLQAEGLTRPACGARSMSTSIALKDWRAPFGAHFPKAPTWCRKCEALAGPALQVAMVKASL